MFDELTLVSRPDKPVFYPGKKYQWNAFDVHSHYTIYDDQEKHYKMFYNNTTKVQHNHGSGIGIAVSGDGLKFASSHAPLLHGKKGGWDRWLWKVRVMRLSEKDWRMWYGGFNVKGLLFRKVVSGVGYATSDDGLHWKRFRANPIIFGDKRWSWWGGQIYDFTPIFVEDSFKALYYSGKCQCIGLMKSEDGVAWQEIDSYPVLKPLPNSWEMDGYDGMICPKWLGKVEDVFVLAYEAGPTGKYCVGLAYSKDLDHWTRDGRNPILTPRQGLFDSKFVADPSLVINGEEMRVYYGAKDDLGKGYVGLAIFAVKVDKTQ